MSSPPKLKNTGIVMFSDIENTAPDNTTDQNGIFAIKIYSKRTKSTMPELNLGEKDFSFSHLKISLRFQ